LDPRPWTLEPKPQTLNLFSEHVFQRGSGLTGADGVEQVVEVVAFKDQGQGLWFRV